MAGTMTAAHPISAVYIDASPPSPDSINNLANAALGRLYDTSAALHMTAGFLRQLPAVADEMPLPPNTDLTATLTLICEVAQRNAEVLRRIQDALGVDSLPGGVGQQLPRR